jgi:GxxExxY protein
MSDGMENYVEPDQELNRISESIIGAAIAVHKSLGPGFLESIYQRAMEVALTKRGIAFVRQYPFTIYFEGEIVGTGRVDLVVENKIVVEIKTVEALTKIHTAQAISYLRATKLRLALLINFNVARMIDGIKRIAL